MPLSAALGYDSRVSSPPRLHLVPTTPEPETPVTASRKRVKAMPLPMEMVVCPRCAGIEMIETRVGVIRRNGRFTKGTSVLICAACQRGGERVAIL